jgi:hypothetical protein
MSVDVEDAGLYSKLASLGHIKPSSPTSSPQD